jgi:predicted RNase H-like HicB family nuclease
MAAKSFLVVIEEAERNCCAYAPDLPGCVATGKTAGTRGDGIA